MNGETILFAGGHYELNDTTDEVTKYYFAGASRIAVRKYVIPQSSTLTYLAGDHLGSTSLAVDASTLDVTETRYKPWGEVRYTTPNKTLPTRYTFTGQYSYVSDEATDLGAAGFGLMFYNARWYDPTLGRFAQADSIVPGGVQGLDRYAYVANNPVIYTDPSGHAQYRNGYRSQIHNNQMGVYDPAPPPDFANGRHGLCDEVFVDGTCEQDIDYLLRYHPQKGIEVIARHYGLVLGGNDRWKYKSRIVGPSTSEDPDGFKVYGWTPRSSANSGDLNNRDGSGNLIPFEDDVVFITGDLLKDCNYDVECIAPSMAHESIHSQIEAKLDSVDFQLPLSPRERDRLHTLEEMVAGLMVVHSGVFSPEALTTSKVSANLSFEQAWCQARDFDGCSSALRSLAQAYGINLDSLVFPLPYPSHSPYEYIGY